MFEQVIHNYIIEVSALIDDGSTISLTDYVKEVIIDKNYIERSLPLFVVNMAVTDEIREILRDNDFSLKLTISLFNNTDFGQDADGNDPLIEEVVVDTVIREYNKTLGYTSFKVEVEGTDSESNMSNTIPFVKYQVAGVPEELIIKNENVINEVYQTTKLEDIVYNILSRYESNRIYIDPVVNTGRFENVLIPPLNIIPSIRYLNTYYGLYTAPLGIFLDLDGSFVYNIVGHNRLGGNMFEIIVPNVNEVENDDIYLSPYLDGENVRQYLKTSPPFNNSDKIISDSLGKTLVFSSYDNGYSNRRRIVNSGLDNNKTRYYWNQYGDKIFEDRIVSTSMNVKQNVNITLRNINPSLFRINTTYNINSPVENINGFYNILSSSTKFFSTNRKNFSSTTNISLMKIE